MELEFAFFDSQIQGSIEDGKLKQFAKADTAGLQSSSVQPRSEDAIDHGRFRGVHQRVALLCVDFDDTLTDGDTTSLLIETAKAQVRFGYIACGVGPWGHTASCILSGANFGAVEGNLVFSKSFLY